MVFTVHVMLALCIMSTAFADLYLHVPRGSNNRLNEKSAARKNNNRLFDSQNNARGGYNVGDKGVKESGAKADQQYNMAYFQSSGTPGISGKTTLRIEWTDQHGCGGNENTSPQKQNCDLILQYMCHDNDDAVTLDTLRNGEVTNTQDFVATILNANPAVKNRGLHEPWKWYRDCYVRERNGGLFVADQKLKNNNKKYSSAIHTRENPNGNRRGYECPEERDYFPYWHPTPWKDIAVLARNASMCRYFTSKSFNVQPYYRCIETAGYSRYNNKKDCEANKGQWMLLYNYLEKDTSKKSQGACEQTSIPHLTYKWAVAYDSPKYEAECLVLLPAPDCKEAPWSRSNHLGNGRDGIALHYPWVLPHFPSDKTKRCVFRMRYNISTDDYDPYYTDSKQNQKKSPIQNDPKVVVAQGYSPLQLAIATNQFGRVFQDRSHVFLIKPRPAGTDRSNIINVNVRGKRGNIVQTFPAVEYDFAPNHLTVTTEDLVHFQWTGSNSHNNGNPGGDGQTGDAGQGTGGTDRNNVLEFDPTGGNFPAPFEKTRMWSDAKVVWIYHGKTDIKPVDLALNMASSGYYRCANETNCPEAAHSGYLASTKAKMNNLLNNAPASYEGVLLRFKQVKTHNYMCTRNNNFSNRSQKGRIVVEPYGAS